jgi:hypothetical protein
LWLRGRCTNTNSTTNSPSNSTPSTPTGFGKFFKLFKISTGWNFRQQGQQAIGYIDLIQLMGFMVIVRYNNNIHIDSFLDRPLHTYYKIAAYNGSNFSALSNTVSILQIEEGVLNTVSKKQKQKQNETKQKHYES